VKTKKKLLIATAVLVIAFLSMAGGCQIGNTDWYCYFNNYDFGCYLD